MDFTGLHCALIENCADFEHFTINLLGALSRLRKPSSMPLKLREVTPF